MKAEHRTKFLDKLPSDMGEDLDRNLCVCMAVPKIDIIEAIVNGATTLEEVKKQTYATMGSGCCTRQIERLIEYLCEPVLVKKRSQRKKLSERQQQQDVKSDTE